MLRVWNLCHTEQELPGSDHAPGRKLFIFDGEAFDRYYRLGHPDFHVRDTEPWELPTIMRRISGWLSSGADFFLVEDHDAGDTIEDDEVSAWLM